MNFSLPLVLAAGEGTLPALDLVVIVAYLVIITVIGLWSVRKTEMTRESYFLAGRSLKWPVVGAALFASNISTIHLVGLAEGGYQHGLLVGNFEWMAAFTLIGLSLIFAPFYFQSRISTLPEYLERRYHPYTRSIVAVMGIMAAMLIHIGISLYAGAKVFEGFFGIDVMTSIVVISVITAIYTVIGGLKAVVVTETVQTVILLVGAVIVTVLAAMQAGDAGINSWEALVEATKPGQTEMLHSDHLTGMTWYGFLLGFPVLGLWYWCSDQTIVQRLLGAEKQRDAQLGALFAGFLKILPVFLMVLPGVLAYALFRDEIGESAQQTLTVLITKLVPTGLRGLIAAALLAALMSTVASALNSTSTLVAVDIIKQLRPKTSDSAQVLIGRVSAVIVMLLAIVWSTQGDKFGSIFEAINKMPAQFLAPPIAAVFFWGIFWRRGTQQAALATLLIGFGLGLVVFAVDLPLITICKDPETGDPLQLVSEVWGIKFLMQAWWGFCLCSLLFIVVSLMTPPPRKEQIDGLTWPSPWAVLTQGAFAGLTDPRLIGAVLFACLVALYACFG